MNFLVFKLVFKEVTIIKRTLGFTGVLLILLALVTQFESL